MIEDFTMIDYRIEMGKQLRSLRELQGWTVEQVATMAGVKAKTIEKIEEGAFNVSFDILAKVADVLGCRISIEDKQETF